MGKCVKQFVLFRYVCVARAAIVKQIMGKKEVREVTPALWRTERWENRQLAGYWLRLRGCTHPDYSKPRGQKFSIHPPCTPHMAGSIGMRVRRRSRKAGMDFGVGGRGKDRKGFLGQRRSKLNGEVSFRILSTTGGIGTEGPGSATGNDNGLASHRPRLRCLLAHLRGYEDTFTCFTRRGVPWRYSLGDGFDCETVVVFNAAVIKLVGQLEAGASVPEFAGREWGVLRTSEATGETTGQNLSKSLRQLADGGFLGKE